jgi:hypothetical protein
MKANAPKKRGVLFLEDAVEPFENGRRFSLRVLRAGKPRLLPLSHANR